MKRSTLFAAAIIFALSLPSFAAEAKAAAGKDLHGAKGAKAGSYEDWCAEHNVPESQCTRCDASLIPAFKATGDWCKKHGLPDSHCRKCNPNLKIARPAKGKK